MCHSQRASMTCRPLSEGNFQRSRPPNEHERYYKFHSTTKRRLGKQDDWYIITHMRLGKFAAHDSDCRSKENQWKDRASEKRKSLLVPSGWPMPYNISVGWNTSELSRGIKGEGRTRAGWVVRPVEILNAERESSRVSEWTFIRWDRQYPGLMADVLKMYKRQVTPTEILITYVTKTPVVECTSKAEIPLWFGWTSQVFTALSDPRRSHNFTWPSKLCLIPRDRKSVV